MPALNFQARFAPFVESGEKRQTIRAHRTHPIYVGDHLYLYTGMRTKQCRKLGEAVCTEIVPVKIFKGGSTFLGDSLLGPRQMEKLAIADGFTAGDGSRYRVRACEKMVDWFEKTHGLPFRGVLIRWGEVS